MVTCSIPNPPCGYPSKEGIECSCRGSPSARASHRHTRLSGKRVDDLLAIVPVKFPLSLGRCGLNIEVSSGEFSSLVSPDNVFLEPPERAPFLTARLKHQFIHCLVIQIGIAMVIWCRPTLTLQHRMSNCDRLETKASISLSIPVVLPVSPERICAIGCRRAGGSPNAGQSGFLTGKIALAKQL